MKEKIKTILLCAVFFVLIGIAARVDIHSLVPYLVGITSGIWAIKTIREKILPFNREGY